MRGWQPGLDTEKDEDEEDLLVILWCVCFVAMDDLVPLCGESYPQVKACDSTDNMFSVIILLISSTVLGIGSSTYWSLGVAYLDDNVRKNKMPVVLGKYFICI